MYPSMPSKQFHPGLGHSFIVGAGGDGSCLPDSAGFPAGAARTAAEREARESRESCHFILCGVGVRLSVDCCFCVLGRLPGFVFFCISFRTFCSMDDILNDGGEGENLRKWPTRAMELA